jgi:hypothetical protein
MWATVGGNPRYEVSTDGRVRNAKTGRELKGVRDPRGYLQLSLYTGETYKQIRVHRLMALAFLGPPPPGKTLVRHLDDVPSNNVIENLAWGNKSENALDAIARGRWFGANVTHCPSGHEYTESNTFSSPSNRSRRCRICRNEYARKLRQQARLKLDVQPGM